MVGNSTSMALSQTLGKLDAICAKLKLNYTDIDSVSSAPSKENSSDGTKQQLLNSCYRHKKKRKTSNPRNIPQGTGLYNHTDFTDKVAQELESNNQNRNIPLSENRKESNYASEISQDKNLVNSDNHDIPFNSGKLQPENSHRSKRKAKFRRIYPINMPNFTVDHTSNAPLDLSIGRLKDNEQNNDCDSNSTTSITSTSDIPNGHSNKHGLLSSSSESSKCGDDISALKDYAESAMNELLNMYGLGEGMDGTAQGTLPFHLLTSAVLKNADSEKSTADNSVNIAADSPSHPPKSNSDSAPFLIERKNYATNSKTETTAAAAKISQKFHGVNHTNNLTKNASYVRNCLTTSFGSKLGSASGLRKSLVPDYSKYLKRYSSTEDCGIQKCKEVNYREHYHCIDCNFRVFLKKEEMIRHFKWHKKRDDSLQHGFMRYSPMDDCGKRFPSCSHNKRQTHYHCLQSGCEKVYISTSDVQMHANYHRKDSAIIQEGFQRFRATEDCGTPRCSFYGQRTTHFHCRRSTCEFTFKNKADMEKHKSYHQKDEILGRDGFKKFMKYEHCNFTGCRFSKISNHIHCIRTGCNYVLHSTAQLYSHKRKHERREFENAYRRFREEQKNKKLHVQVAHPLLPSGPMINVPITAVSPAASPVLIPSARKEDKNVHIFSMKQESEESADGQNSFVTEQFDSESSSNFLNKQCADDITTFNTKTAETEKYLSLKQQLSSNENESFAKEFSPTQPEGEKLQVESDSGSALFQSKLSLAKVSELCGEKLNSSLSLPIAACQGEKANLEPASSQSTKIVAAEKKESWKQYMIRYTANDPCSPRCEYLYKDHYHCKTEDCHVIYKSKDGVREHARYHEMQERITPVAYSFYEEHQPCSESCPHNLKKKHYHCLWADCNYTISNTDNIFARLDHYHIHQYADTTGSKFPKGTFQKSEEDIGRRRRGRPPKYPRLEIPIVPKVELKTRDLDEAKDSQAALGESSDTIVPRSFKVFQENEACPDKLCIYFMKRHYHCTRARCHHATDRMDVLNLHSKDFHNFVNILKGFEFFDRNVNCRRTHCNNKTNKHYHCVRPRCDYSFVRHSTMSQHEKKHKPKTCSVSQNSFPILKKEPTAFVPIMPAVSKVTLHTQNKAVIKSSGTFYPLSTIPSISATLPTTASNQYSHTGISMATVFSPSTVTAAATPNSTALPLLLQQKTDSSATKPSWTNFRSKMHYAVQQNCGRPFCKLKKKDHYHCLHCNQAFSDPSRLRCHIGKHGMKFKRDSAMRLIMPNTTIGYIPSNFATTNKSCNSAESHNKNMEPTITNSTISTFSPIMINIPSFTSAVSRNNDSIALTISEPSANVPQSGSFDKCINNSNGFRKSKSTNGEQQKVELEINFAKFRRSSRKRTATKHDDFVDSNECVPKQRRLCSPRDQKEDNVPEGYVRVRYSENCNYSRCSYKHMVTHFHCLRHDCGYGFSDRSRIIQHKLRHERIDNITGHDFKQFRASVSCAWEDCEFDSKSSHYHCLKCPFMCTDTSKVTAHRKHHMKMENISLQGFQKFTSSDDCKLPSCIYNSKQTHYHCMHQGCNFTVLGLSQMTPHRFKHVSETASTDK